MQFAMLTLAAVLIAVDFSISKQYQKKAGTTPAAGFRFSAIQGLFTMVIFFFINGCKFSFSWYSFALAAVLNTLCITYTLLGFRIMRYGSMALYTMFLMTGGMTLPYLYGLCFLDEPFSVLRTVALVMIIGGVILSNFSNEKINPKQIVMCFAVFFLNGFVSIVSKIHQIETIHMTVSAAEFVMLGGIFKILFAGILYLITKKNIPNNERITTIKILPFVLFSALAGGISYLFQLLGAVSLPATVLYPFITGGGIIFSTLAGKIVFREKLSKKLIVSVLLCFAGTIMFL